MPHWLSAWLGKRPVIDPPSSRVIRTTDTGRDYNAVGSWVYDTGPISAVPASFIMVYHDPVIDAQAAASALSRHGHNKARAKIRAKCDEMAAELGWPLPEWRDL